MIAITIKSQLIESIEAKGGKWVADTKFWNAHNSDMTNKRSNVAKLIAKLPKCEAGFQYVAIIGAYGRSQHSASDVHIFKAPVATIGTAEALFRSFEKF